MTGILVDSNVIIDLLTLDKDWLPWSLAHIVEHGNSGNLCINKIIYAEVSLAFNSIQELDSALPPLNFSRREMPWEASFEAAKAFHEYRKNGGTRSLPLPDFFIGAHAKVEKLTILTRDPKPYRHYFPDVTIIAPF